VRAAALVVAILACATPAFAQSDAPAISLRPFLTVSNQSYRASKTFDAIFGQTTEPAWGGGLQIVVWDGRIYGQVSASRILKSNGELVGERVIVSDGRAFGLGIPLRVRIQPVEVTGGYRFTNLSQTIVPYAGIGFGSYHYTEQSDMADPSENLDTRHRGFILHGGAEVRVVRWIGVAADAQFTHIPGILGSGGASAQFASSSAAERDLGGWAGRLTVLFGR
jgi:hypothetical protein